MVDSKKTFTIRDIAEKAKVSHQTVSLVINNKPGVSEATRQRILKLMDELDYQPNRAAQMLAANRSKTLELITVDVIYGGRLADSTKNMAHTAKEMGYTLLISETTAEGLAKAIDNAAARTVDGVILYAPRLQRTDAELREIFGEMPFVRRDYVPHSRIAWIGFDQAYATRLAVEHLIALGHRQIAAIPPYSDLINGYWRFNTWRSVLLEHGLTPGPYAAGDYSMGSGYEAAHQLVASGEPFSAVVIGTDNMAMGALRGFKEHGLLVPDDLSMVSFDNTELATYTDPPLTTVDFKFARQDELSVKYLLDLIHDPDMELYQSVLMSDLMVRQSTRQWLG